MAVSGGGDHISLVVLDDHVMMAEGLAAAIAAQPGFAVLACLGVADELARVCAELRPDVAIVDDSLPDTQVPDLIRDAKHHAPGLAVVTLLSDRPRSALIEQLLDAGCTGIVLKRANVASLATVIRRVANGEVVVTTELLDILTAQDSPHRPHADLSSRELQVLLLLAEGRSTDEIVSELYVSVHTVRNHIRSILQKLHARSRLEAVAVAMRIGLVERSGV